MFFDIRTKEHILRLDKYGFGEVDKDNYRLRL